jgi:hypothetical protein
LSFQHRAKLQTVLGKIKVYVHACTKSQEKSTTIQGQEIIESTVKQAAKQLHNGYRDFSYHTRTRYCDATTAASHPHFTTTDHTREHGGPLRGSQPDSFHLLDLVQGVVVGGHAGVVHLVEPHHHRVAGVWVLHRQIRCSIFIAFSGFIAKIIEQPETEMF